MIHICSQCGETAQIGGYCSVPGVELNESWRCLACMMAEVKEAFTKQGIKKPKVLIVRPDQASNSSNASNSPKD
jgi:hypothetical protein